MDEGVQISGIKWDTYCHNESQKKKIPSQFTIAGNMVLISYEGETPTC